MLNIEFKNSLITIQTESEQVDLDYTELRKLIETLKLELEDRYYFQAIIDILTGHLHKIAEFQQANNFSYDWF